MPKRKVNTYIQIRFKIVRIKLTKKHTQHAALKTNLLDKQNIKYQSISKRNKNKKIKNNMKLRKGKNN